MLDGSEYRVKHTGKFLSEPFCQSQTHTVGAFPCVARKKSKRKRTMAFLALSMGLFVVASAESDAVATVDSAVLNN